MRGKWHFSFHLIPETPPRDNSSVNRRNFLAYAAALTAKAARPASRLAAEAYIFQQYAERIHRPLEAIVPRAMSITRAAGFREIELSPAFLPPSWRNRTLAAVRDEKLGMPSVYVGGPMHEAAGASSTIAAAIEYGTLCQPFGCKAVVHNPDPKPHDARKTDSELAYEADALSRMGHSLAQHGLQLRVHHHTPQLEENAREWHVILQHTDPQYVYLCVDVDWAYEAGFRPLEFLREAGNRVREIHVRSARNKVWLQDLEDSDIDYRAVARYLTQAGLTPLIVVELAYRPQTVITRPLVEDLRLSRIYAEKVFGVKANA